MTLGLPYLSLRQRQMIIPLKDENRIGTYPVITTLIIFLNVVIFIYELSSGRRMGLLVEKLGLIPFEISHMVDLPPHLPVPVHLTLLTSMFLHGGFLHLLGNLLYLWVFGYRLENTLGPLRFLLFYLLSGILAGLTQVVSNPSSRIPMIGASGAISGVLGAYLILFPRAKIVSLVFLGFFFTRVNLPAIILLGLWIFYQIINSTQTFMRVGGGNVAWFAHVGGFFAGLILIGVFRK